jgi:hypothetical protein
MNGATECIVQQKFLVLFWSGCILDTCSSCLGQLHRLALLAQDLARLRQLAAVRGLVSSELRARLWPVLAGGSDVPALLQSSPSSHAVALRRSSEIGRASPALSLAAVAPLSPRVGTSLSSDYTEWASGTHKDTGTVSCRAVPQEPGHAVGSLHSHLINQSMAHL